MIGKEYAKGVIKKYTYSSEHSNIYEFCKIMHISINGFNACLNVIKVEDNYLYNKCLVKLKQAGVDNYYKYLEKCRDLARGIQTGFFGDGIQFDMLEFYHRLPFTGEKGRIDFLYCRKTNPAIEDSKYIFGRIEKFTEIADPDANKIIMDFIKSKRITKIRIVDELWLMDKYKDITRFYKKVIDSNGNEFIIDRQLTVNDIDKVIEYMKRNNLLFLEPVFIIVLERYFIGEINLDEDKPHKLVRKH